VADSFDARHIIATEGHPQMLTRLVRLLLQCVPVTSQHVCLA
jgi:hypothetical protein